MTALAADRNTAYQDAETISAPVAASTTIFAGSLVAANASGYAVPGSTATTLTALGRAEESVVNAGSAGDKSVLVRRLKAFKFANDGSDAVVQADLGKTCYITDDQTVSHTSTGKSAAGKVVKLDSDGVWVWIA